MGFRRQEYWSGLPFPSLGDVGLGLPFFPPILHHGWWKLCSSHLAPPPPLYPLILLASLPALEELEAAVKELPSTKLRVIRIRGLPFCTSHPGCSRRGFRGPSWTVGTAHLLWPLRDPAFCWPASLLCLHAPCQLAHSHQFFKNLKKIFIKNTFKNWHMFD